MISSDDRHSLEAALELIKTAKSNDISAVLLGSLDDDGATFVVATSEALAIAAQEEAHDKETEDDG